MRSLLIAVAILFVGLMPAVAAQPKKKLKKRIKIEQVQPKETESDRVAARRKAHIKAMSTKSK